MTLVPPLQKGYAHFQAVARGASMTGQIEAALLRLCRGIYANLILRRDTLSRSGQMANGREALICLRDLCCCSPCLSVAVAWGPRGARGHGSHSRPTPSAECLT